MRVLPETTPTTCRGFSGGILVITALAGLSLSSFCVAQTPQRPLVAASVAWSTVADYRTRQARDWRTPALLVYGIAIHESRPALSSAEVLSYIEGLESILRGDYSDALAARFRNTASLIKPRKTVDAGIIKSLTDFQSSIVRPPPSDVEFYRAYADNPFLWLSVYKKAERDSVAREVIAQWLVSRLAIPNPSSNTETILKSTPEIEIAMNSANVKIALDDAARGPQYQLAEMKVLISDLDSSMKLVASSVGSPPAPTDADDKRIKAAEDSIKQEKANERARLDVFSNLAQVSGNKELQNAAKFFTKVGQPLIDLASEVHLLQSGSKAASTLMVASSGVGVAVAMMSAFSQEEDASLAQMKALKKDLSNLRDEMLKQFGVINQKLDGLLNAARETLELLRQNKESVDDLRIATALNVDKLEEIQVAVSTIARKITDRETRKSQIRCLTQKSRRGKLYDSKLFDECVDDFLAASQESYHDILPDNSSQNWPTDRSKLASELLKGAPEHFPFLVNVMRSRGNAGLPPPSSLPNPFVWANAADAYAQFAVQWSPRAVPSADLEKLRQQGRQVIAAEQRLLGADRETRKTLLKKLADDTAKDAESIQSTLDGFYADSREAIIRKEGAESDLTTDLPPCPEVKQIVDPLLHISRLPTYRLDSVMIQRADHVYRSGAAGLLKLPYFCYSEVRFGAPWGHTEGGHLETATVSIRIDIRSEGKAFLQFEGPRMGFVAGDFYIFTRGRDPGDDERGPQLQWRMALSNDISTQLGKPESISKYVDLPRAKFDANLTYRTRAWTKIANEQFGNTRFRDELENITGDRRLLELLFAFGAPDSLRSRLELGNLLSSYSSARLPDRSLILDAFQCFRGSKACSTEASTTVVALRDSGAVGLYGPRTKTLTQMLLAVAADDPLNQADNAVSLALLHLEQVHGAQANRKSMIESVAI